ncbi:MAG: hypothetical protein P8Z36_17285 [Gemmatimonadota bacterium]|jgi:hypothetical protein
MTELFRHAGNRFRRHARQVWTSRGGGFYGFVATLTFLYVEAVDLVGDIASLPRFAALDVGWIIGWFVNNAIQAVWNLIWSAIWPWEWIQRFGVNVVSALLLVACYGLYRLLRPTVLRLLQDPEAGPQPQPRPSDR